MAMNIKIFLAVALAGMGLEFAYLKRDGLAGSPDGQGLISRQIREVRGEIFRTSNRLSLTLLTNRILNAVRSVEPGRLTVLGDSTVGPALVRELAVLAGSRQPPRGPASDEVNTVIYATDPQGRGNGLNLYRVYLLPGAANSGRCIAALAVRRNRITGTLRTREAQAIDLGPCSLLDRFGIPGREIGRWFANEGGTGTAAHWAPSPRDPDESTLRSWDYDNVGLYSCASGNDAGCRALLNRQQIRREWFGWDYPGVYLIQSNMFRAGPETHLLYDLMEQFGPEKFQRFWKSDLALEAAFERVYGMQLTAWMSGWARQFVRPAGNTRRIPLILTLIAAGSLGLALVYTNRRQVRTSSG